MASEMTFDDIFDQNPHLDREGISDALETVRELRRAGVAPRGYKLETHSQGLRHTPEPSEDDAFRVVVGIAKD